MDRLPKQLAGVAAACGLVGSARANPVIVAYHPNLHGMNGETDLLLLATFTALAVAYLLIRRLLHPRVGFRHALSTFLQVNLITFLPTQLLGTLLLGFAELFPLVLAPPLYRRILGDRRAGLAGLDSLVVMANLAGFAMGLLCFHSLAGWREGAALPLA